MQWSTCGKCVRKERSSFHESTAASVMKMGTTRILLSWHRASRKPTIFSVLPYTEGRALMQVATSLRDRGRGAINAKPK